MNTISREELKAKLDRGDAFTLIMALAEWAYRAKRIPGSIYFESLENGITALGKDEDIVVYCSDEACAGSQQLYHFLTQNGFTNVRRYAGGLSDWEAAGLPLAGEMIS